MLFFKRLEIHGFKSFANKTNIELFPGITIIVGPNGCGKSNVFDSIRWALGEQSAKSMRGSRMGDVIFSGSGSMKATGMARVNLVLNNLNRHLPIDFDEVSISRRLFRTGESEYNLNNTQCRLKDISNLLMDTGIGTDSYSVMEQGKVDAIINSKPLERRAIFDEAAGISKYKARKDEALNKLSRTEDDLLRLADVINEVKRQAGSLKRQASKAEKYKRLASELQALEMELLVCRFFTFKDSTAEKEAEYHELAARVAELKAELAKVDEEQLSGRSTVEEVQQELELTQSLQFEVNSSLQETVGKIALIEQRAASAAERRDSLSQQLTDFERQVAEIEEHSRQLEAEASAQTETLAAQKAQYEEKQAHYEILKGDSDSSGAEMGRLRQEIAASTRLRMERENEVRMARAMAEKLEDEFGRSDSEIGMLRQQIEALSVEREERHTSAEENEQLLAALKADLANAREGLRERESRQVEMSNNLEQTRRETHQCRSRHDALAELQENFEGYYRGVKEVMIAARRGQVQGLLGVVSTLIEAKKEHELAVEVALGSQAQDIIVQTADHGKAAIRWLKEARVGRATFLPLDLIEGRETSNHLRNVIGRPGVVGFATDLVKYDPKIRQAVQYLLGNVIVVTNLDVAVGLEREGFRTKFVTLEGDMVSSHGAMSGGSIKAAGLLNRTREIKELADNLVTLNRREQELEQQTLTLREEIRSLRETHEKLAKSVNEQEIEAARSRKDFELLEHRLTEKKSQLEKLETRRQSMLEEQQAHITTQERGASQVEELAAQVAMLEAQLAEIETQATAKQQEVAAQGRELGDLQVAISTGSERLANITDKLESRRRELARIVDSREDKQREIERLQAQEAESTTEVELLREEVARLQERQREISSQLSQQNQLKESISSGLRQLSERAQTVHRDFNEAQNNLHEVELKRTEFTLQLENINVQAQEKFSMQLEDVIRRVFQPDWTPEQPASESLEEQPVEQVNVVDSTGEEAARVTEETETAVIYDIQQPEQPEEQPFEVTEEMIATLRNSDEIARTITELRSQIDSLGPVHVGAIDEYNELNQRFEFLTTQEKDLVEAKNQLTETIAKIDSTTKDLFTKAFEEIRVNFEQVYRRLFGGGRADLVLTEENGVLESGIDIVAQPPGKKPQHISLLSGGEKALTAISLLFAIFMRKPSPFCILDEIDAPLDDKNIERFKDLVREFAHTTQFIIITHNKQTMALANTIYGVTMEEQGVSRVVSLRLDEIDESEIVREAALSA